MLPHFFNKNYLRTAALDLSLFTEYDAFLQSLLYIRRNKFDLAYRLCCRFNAIADSSRGIGCDWDDWWRKGISHSLEIICNDMMNKSDHPTLTACAIYSNYSGTSLNKCFIFMERMCKEIKVPKNIDKEYIRNEFSVLSSNINFNSYKSCDIECYCFVSTLDDSTCPICGELDGKIFPVSEKQIGLNCPPMHKGCRCTTISVISGDIPKERRARNPITKRNELIPFITYSDWVKQFK